MVNLPRVIPEYFPLQGGLDLATPPIRLSPGKCIDAQNYEPEISGGYRRINGFERFSGKASPTSAEYYILPITTSGSISVGDTLTGATSGATCKVLLVVSSTQLVVGRVVGSFTTTENLTNGGVVATMAGTAALDGASDPSDHADYKLLAADDLRTLIAAVPGSGRIRGVWVYNDVVYAFRDNAGGTAGDMYKSTASGWSQVTFGKEIQFSGATAQISDGNTITGATSGATATVVRAMLRTGTWTVSGAGTLILSGVTGTFQNGENIQVGGVTKAVAASASTNITRAAGGSMEFCNYNFTGSSSGTKMYGCDGVNLAFEFDGTNYIPIRTGMTTDTPSHIIGYKNYLFLSFLGSVQNSSLGDPYQWSVVTGANEIATGDTVTGFLPQGGTSSGSALAIFTKGKTYTLYGSSTSDFRLVATMWDIGYSAFTMQQVGNNAYGLTGRGIQALLTTLTYGDFDYASISHLIQPYMTARLGTEVSSTTIHAKNQYRIFFSDGSGLIVGLTGDKVSGLMPINYGKVVRCITTTFLSDGTEVTYFGSDDGYVYQADVGTSFDGSEIEAWVRLAFNHDKSPQLLKTYRRARLEVAVEEYAEVNISYDLGYGNSDVMPSAILADTVLTGGGSYWDQFTWDEFTWDVQSTIDPNIQITGTQKNISLLFYSNRAQDLPHTLQGVTLLYTPRRLER